MTLQNGWVAYSPSTGVPAVAYVSGYVTFSGAMRTAGTNAAAFTLPAGLRPAADVYVPVDLCNATKGRLFIATSGVVTVQAATAFSNAQCFTSLDGASYALRETGSTALTLVNGWTNAPFGTSNAAARYAGGIVHLQGAVSSGTTSQITTLPASMRPAANVYIPVDLCSATNGRLLITPAGAVSVEAEGGTFSNAQCFTSLDGASFAPSAAGFASLSLLNGWTNAPFATSGAAYRNINGVVHLKGAIATTGTSTLPFTMPIGSRPTSTVYVPVDMCNATNGRLIIEPTGTVTVQAETSFSNAQCLTSLDGASFDATPYLPLTLQNGWLRYSTSTGVPAVANESGYVTLTGAMRTAGTNAVAFTLPVGLRPAADVYVPVDLCNATKGRLVIASTGVVTVQAATAFSNAQCFTSLDGASFALSETGSTPLTLVNGWTNAPFGTSNAAARYLGGIVHLQGAVASGTTGVITTLPASLRPATNVYVPVDLCNGTNGRLLIQPSGTVTVESEGAFSNAQCFTSLDGASFAPSPAGFAPLTLLNGWTNAPFATSAAAYRNIGGVVHLKGAIATTGTSTLPFTMPIGSRPASTAYIPVDMCNATNGRLIISPNGSVTVQAETAFSNAQCLTSLDGASFANAN